MATETFTDGQVLTAAELNTIAQQAGNALQTTNNLSDLSNPATAIANLLNSLPTTLPASPGVWWLNGGLLSKS